jgi:hypothetical protein
MALLALLVVSVGFTLLKCAGFIGKKKPNGANKDIENGASTEKAITGGPVYMSTGTNQNAWSV